MDKVCYENITALLTQCYPTRSGRRI